MGWSGHWTGVLIIAVVVIGPVWLTLHYKSRRASGHVDGELSAKLDELSRSAARMQARIDALEQLLDVGRDKGKPRS